MNELDDLIRFENENTSLDFKATQHPKHEDLLKDLIAMANANVSGDRLIIVGMKHLPDGSRKFWGIKQGEFVDSATYHQLIRENVEPEIPFEYIPYQFEAYLLGVFRIYDCNDQPYTMRKDFGSLRAGDAFIRKGTHQPRLMRQDLDRIWERRQNEFTAILKVGFDVGGMPTEITIPAIGKMTLASDRAADEIRGILAEREKKVAKDLLLSREMFEAGIFRSVLGPPRYEHRTSKELSENLETVKETYREDDLHELYEVHSTKVNLSILNEGESYVEDASIEIRIPRVEGLRVANKIHPVPDRSGPFGVPRLSLYSMLGRNYPTVKYYKQHIRISQSVGTLRHGKPVTAFEEPLRVVFGRELVGQKLSLDCTVFGKQLRAPRKETLMIEVVEP
jgi:hypothetical protein